MRAVVLRTGMPGSHRITGALAEAAGPAGAGVDGIRSLEQGGRIW